MHADCFVIGVILQSGSRVFSWRVYIAHDWLSWFPSRRSRISLPHVLELSTFYFLAREMSSDKWGWHEHHFIWGLRQGQGPERRHFSGFAWVYLFLVCFFFTLPLCNVCFVHLNNIPGTWWLLYYCIAMLQTTDNPLPLGSQPQQWSMGQILAGVSWEAAGGRGLWRGLWSICCAWSFAFGPLQSLACHTAQHGLIPPILLRKV